MLVKIQRLTDNAKIPTNAHESDFCYDVYATSVKRVGWRTWEYGVGIAYEIIRDNNENVGEIYVGDYNPMHADSRRWLRLNLKDTNIKLSIDFRPRSSVWKTGMILSNCEGTLDELYRGEVKAVFYHINPFKKKYKIGERIGQIKLGFTLPIEFEEGEINVNTERGTGGFGSTGK